MTHEYTFKTYIANGREHYEYSTDALIWGKRNALERQGQLTAIKKDFPFPESLLTLLYLDTNGIDLLVKRADKAIREFLPTKDERYVVEALSVLDELANVHVYFVSAISKCRFSPKRDVVFYGAAYRCYTALYTTSLAGLKPVKPWFISLLQA